MDLRIEPVTDKNIDVALAMGVGSGQDGFVEPVKECLEEAEKRKCWRPVVLYDGTKPVGFAMYGFFTEYLPDGRLWLDRFLIDAPCQGHGYGKTALVALLNRLDQEYGQKAVYLSIIPENARAEHLYREFGFVMTGELDIHGELVMKREPAK